MSGPRSNRVRGHALRDEGMPFEKGVRLPVYGSLGYGRYECGAESPLLDTTAARKRWHRQHKAELLAAPLAGDERGEK